MASILCFNTQRCCPPDWWNGGPSLSFAAPPSACYGESYSFTFTTTAGTPPFTWSIDEAPPELMLDPDTGVLSGIAFELGDFSFVVTVTDVFGKTAEQSYSLTIEACE